MSIAARSLFTSVGLTFSSEFWPGLANSSLLKKWHAGVCARNEAARASAFATGFAAIKQFKPAFQQDETVVPFKPAFAYTGVRPFSFLEMSLSSRDVLRAYLTDFFAFKPVQSDTGTKAQKALQERCLRERVLPLISIIEIGVGKITKGARDSVTVQSPVSFTLQFVDERGQVVRGSAEKRKCLCEYQMRTRNGHVYIENLHMALFDVE